MPNNRETNNLPIDAESISAASAIDSGIISRPASQCIICGEFFSRKHQGYKFYICDDCKENMIKLMKEVKKRLIERKGKYNESK